MYFICLRLFFLKYGCCCCNGCSIAHRSSDGVYLRNARNKWRLHIMRGIVNGSFSTGKLVFLATLFALKWHHEEIVSWASLLHLLLVLWASR